MKSAIAVLASSIAVLLVVSGCATAHQPGAVALQGTWSGREPGIIPEAPRQLVIAGNHIEYRGAVSNDWGKGTFTVREDTHPKQLRIALTKCGIAQYTGKTCYMIYQIDGGTLTAVANEPGNPLPPSSFDAVHARHMIFNKQ